MAHPQQAEFCLSVKRRFPQHFVNRLVLDIGALDINGNNQFLFEDCLYLGIDLAPGRNVDFVSKGHELALPDASFDSIISTECFEHDQFYDRTLRNVVRLLKPGGMLLFSCATTGRPEHGTRRTTPHDAPLIQGFGEWSDYYKNLEESDIRAVLDVDAIFSEYGFSTNDETKDLYFWGIKKGELVTRDNYSFQVARPALRAAIEERDRFIQSMQQSIAEMKKEQRDARERISELESQLARIHRSISWRLTVPVRIAGRLMRGEFGLVFDAVRSRFGHPDSRGKPTAPADDDGGARRQRILSITRGLYHALPVSPATKLKLRRMLAPYLHATLEAVNGGSMVKALDRVKAARQQLEWGGEREAAFQRALKQIGGHSAVFGPVSQIIVLPFLATGGAERVALNFAQALRDARPHGSVLLVVADRAVVSDRVDVPEGVALLVLDSLFDAAAGYEQKQRLLEDLVLAIRPHAFHNINSEVAWGLILAGGDRLAKATRLFASIFAFQFAPNGKTKTGYAAYFLKPGLPYLTGLLSDNRRFVQDAAVEYSLSAPEREKMRVVYNPVRCNGNGLQPALEFRLQELAARRPNRRLRVLWAGRLDEEKRVDLLLKIMEQTDFADFDVFGQAVVDSTAELPNRPNVNYRGAFAAPEELVRDVIYDAFVFTSRWEGMPNILLEIGALGIPVIAPTVGGVGELIKPDTGYPLAEQPDASDYVSALQQIRIDPEQAAARAEALRQLIDERHSWQAFATAIATIPEYLEPKQVINVEKTYHP